MADVADDYARLRDGTGAVWLDREAVRVAGTDAATFLDGQLSQDLNPLEVGAAAEALRSVTGHRLLPRYELREEDEEDANGSTLSGEELVRRFIEEFDAEEILEEEG